jgi:hypothetical protein
MSSVRMCDKCGTVFSELEDGWQTFTGTTRRRNEEGELVAIQQTLDTCPACAVIPKVQLERGLQSTQEQRDLDARIAKLEKETGVAQ